jgi:hypothetical protein
MTDEPSSEAFVEKKRVKVTNEYNELIKQEEKEAEEVDQEYGDEEPEEDEVKKLDQEGEEETE